MDKTCSICKTHLPLSEFSMNRSAKDGKMSRCKKCNRKVVKDHYEKYKGTEEYRRGREAKLLKYIIILKDSGQTLKQIAEKTGLDESSISYYLRGKRQVGMNAVSKFESREVEG